MSHVLSPRPLVVALLFAAGCGQPGSGLGLGRNEHPLAGATPESGFEAVGAVTYEGVAFCTGTLVAPHWVLTAASCVDDAAWGGPIPLSSMAFFLGTNVAEPSTGSTFVIGAVRIHEGYSLSQATDNVALVYLLDAPTVAPLPRRVQPIDGLVQAEVLYVGFGATSEGGATGLKRSVTLPITDISARTYRSYSSAAGICTGDLGGPGLLQTGTGSWEVAGVNSYYLGCMASYGVHTRVDAYADWISSHLSAPPSCTEVPALCACAEACLPDGSCDDARCQAPGCLSDASLCGCAEACLSDGSCDDTRCPCTDADGDGVCEPDDCDDTDATVHPGAEETCDGRDDDCSGTADEGCSDAAPPEAPRAAEGGCATAAGGTAAGLPAWLVVAALALRRRRRP